MIRVMLVRRRAGGAERLRQMLGPIPGLEIVGEAADGEQAIERIVDLRPDLVLLDIQMPAALVWKWRPAFQPLAPKLSSAPRSINTPSMRSSCTQSTTS